MFIKAYVTLGSDMHNEYSRSDIFVYQNNKTMALSFFSCSILQASLGAWVVNKDWHTHLGNSLTMGDSAMTKASEICK